MTPSSTYRERNSTADRALTVLQMFRSDKPEVSAVEVAETLGVARSTAYRYLETLVAAQFLTDTGRGAFRLGLRMLELGRVARYGIGLTDLCVPAMRDLAEDLHQTVLLTKLMGNAVVCLEREEAMAQYVRLSYERGSLLDVNAGASAMVLLMSMTDDQVRALLGSTPLHRFTENTLTDTDAVLRRLTKIRADGYAVSRGEVDSTAMGIAAPLFDSRGAVVAGLSVVLIRSLVSKEQIERITAAVISSARALSEQLALIEP